MRIRFVAALLAIGLASRGEAQQLSPEQREVWKVVDTRWKAWESGDLPKMLQSYHPSFRAWSSVTGRLDDSQALMTGWKALLEVERVESVQLEPVAVQLNGDFATAYYVSREKVARITRDTATKQSVETPMLLSSLWSEYLTKSNGRWMTIGYSSVECNEPEPEGSACRKK
jgi:hypothetical protein